MKNKIITAVMAALCFIIAVLLSIILSGIAGRGITFLLFFIIGFFMGLYLINGYFRLQEGGIIEKFKEIRK